ncbi:helix-turn-helix domain-containing protein [Gandjariella thermophila]|uniref:Transcriptional regulator n=1 Tax=Gandjariella thermophila TaxID=1931992 RepID=A0A4D4JF68_9PSEU|nr:helix-turn-helix transcriptional regulator [Gandjariella thermophila]GDY34062.1 transcriptional regulator [Gandjariella thermophila]
MPEPNPTVKGRQLGTELRTLREGRKLTCDEAGRQVGMSASKISRIENGRRGARVEDVAALLALYRVHGGRREELLDLARQANDRGWWQRAYGDTLSARFRTYVGFEADAKLITNFESMLVPGLLQTAEYTRAVMRGGKVPEDLIEGRVAARLARKSILSREFPPHLVAIVDEQALRRPVGDTDVMRQQLDHLVTMANRPHIRLHVVPLSVGAHAGVEGPFVILDFDSAPAIVHLENHTSSLFLDDPRDVKSYRKLVMGLTNLALDQRESVEFIAGLARELGDR